MSSSNIATAKREYYSRPADERFATFQGMIDAARKDREQSAERVYNLRDLHAIAYTPDGMVSARITLRSGATWTRSQI